MIGRVSAVLGVFSAEQPVLSVSEITRRTGLAKSVTSRIIAELVGEDFLERTEGGVCVGIRMFELGELAQRSKELRKLALATMADLRQATGLTVQLSVLHGIENVYVEILRGRDAQLAIRSRVGGRVLAYATAGGKAVLAHSPDELIDQALSGELVSLGPATITDPAVLRRQFEQVRETGFAHESQESNPGVCCVACPILGPDGAPIAAISVTAPVGKVEVLQFAPAVRIAALGLNRRIRANTLFNAL